MRDRVGNIVDEGWKAAQLVVEAATEPVLGAVERGVHTAYTVIDDYMARGRDAARRHDPAAGDRSMTDRPNGNSSPFDQFAGPLGPMMGQWMTMMRAWSDAMMTMAPAMAQGPFGAAAATFGMASPKEVSILVTSGVPTEVRASVQAADQTRLTVDALTRDGGAAPSLAAITAAWQDGRVRLSVTIPTDQPPGRYTGSIRDGAGRACGTIVVNVAPGTA